MTASSTPIHGTVASGFEAVRTAFLDNFETGEECGASFSATLNGEIIVDLYGGYKDRKKNADSEWQADTLIPVFSSSKAIAALIVALLADADKLGYNQKVTTIWPEFGQNGKNNITIGDVLSHQAGLSGITDPHFKPIDWLNLEKTCATLAAQAPIWEPGTASGYHPATVGYIIGEIVRRVDGRTLGEILSEEICKPHNLDFYIGLPASEHARCASLIKPRKIPDLGQINEATRAAFMQPWSSADTSGENQAHWRSLEIPSTNGHGTAKSLARLMQIFVNGKLDGITYLAEDILRDLKNPRISAPNLVLPFDLSICAGVMQNSPNLFYGPTPTTVGHSGWGGSCVMADDKTGLTASYVMNKQSHFLMGDPRSRKLIDALYSCL